LSDLEKRVSKLYRVYKNSQFKKFNDFITAVNYFDTLIGDKETTIKLYKNKNLIMFKNKVSNILFKKIKVGE